MGLLWLALLPGCLMITEKEHDRRLDPDWDFVPWPLDCAPEDPERHPFLDEIPDDGIDNDCDGVIDDGEGQEPAHTGDTGT